MIFTAKTGQAMALLFSVFALFLIFPASIQAKEPQNFLFVGGDDLAEHAALIARPDITGVQKIYAWRTLEPRKGVYDFSAIEADLEALQARDRKLFVQVQDRFFSPTARRVPDYILNEPRYEGGLARQFDNAGDGVPIGRGWTAKQWNPHVRARFQSLLVALGQQFDGRLFGVNLPETAFDRVEGDESADGFDCDAYFFATLDTMAALRAAFHKTAVVQYINFWPCEWNNDHRYMERAFAVAQALGVGVGGPDIAPNRPGQMKNSYRWLNHYRGKLSLVAMAVQEPTLTYTDPHTGKRPDREEFVTFAGSYLGADIIFWTPRAPWLSE